MSDSDQPLKTRIREEMKDALRQGDRRRLSVIRLILAAVKQREIDDQVELDDAGVLDVLQKMTKQRRDSIDQYRAAEREDLAARYPERVELMRSRLHTWYKEVDAKFLEPKDNGPPPWRPEWRPAGVRRPR